MLSLSSLRPDDNAFIDVYHEILKHELCLMRLGDICFNLNGYYVSRSRQSVVHNVDAKLTMLDLVYAVLNSGVLGFDNKFDVKDFNEFLNKLIESRLLVDLPCSDKEKEIVLSALDQGSVIEAGLGDNPFIYYYMASKLRDRLREGFEEVKKYLKESADRCFRSAYGELIRLFRYEVALPYGLFNNTPYRVLESYVLPFIEEFLPQRKPERLDEVCRELMKRYGDVGKAVCEGLRGIGVSGLDDYQEKMIKEMVERFEVPKVTVVSAPTGSGKTLIFMTYVILKLLERGGIAVIVYPTKVLAREQLEFMLNLLYIINASSGVKIHAYIIDGDSPRSAKALKSRPFRGGIRIKDRTLFYDDKGFIRLIGDGSSGEEVDWISEVRPTEIKEPAVVITNHSMLSLHLNKGSPWVRNLLSKLNTIVIDEAHIYMNDVELLNTLHFLLTRLFVTALVNEASRIRDINDLAVLDGIRELIKKRGIDLILSSATLGDRKVIEEGVTIGQLGGVNLTVIRRNQEPNLRPLLKWLLDIYGEGGRIYVPYYDVMTSDSARRRLVITAVNFPIPSESAQTPFIEGLASAIIWTEALSNGLRRAYGVDKEFHALAFIDNKLTQREVFNRLIRRGIEEEVFHADKLLISPLMNVDTRGREIVDELLRSTDDPLTDQYLSTYSHLQLFYKHKAIIEYVRKYRESVTGVEHLRKFVEDALSFAESLRNAHMEGAKFWNRNNNAHYVMLHNADLEMGERSHVENVLKGGKWRLTIATSTLELGVNIPGVALVIQYGSPPSSESFIQRVGRAGRDNNSLRISFGALFLKSVGKDISYIDETQAFKSLFNLEQPRYSERPDKETLTRFMALLYRDLAEFLSEDKVKTVLRKTLVELYGITSDAVTDVINEVMELVDNYRKIYDKMTNSGEEKGLHDLKELIDQAKNSLSSTHMNLTSAAKSLRQLLKKPLLKNLDKTTLEEIAINIENLAQRVSDIYDHITSTQISRLITTELIKTINELKSIEASVNDLIKRVETVTGKPSFYSDLRNTLDRLNDAISGINHTNSVLLNMLSTAVTVHGKLNKPHIRTRLLEALVSLIVGNRLPNPAVSEGVTGFILTCNGASLSGSNAELNCDKPRDSSRDDVIKTLPFKYYE